MGEPTFDIFMETMGKDVMWMQAVSGLENARQRMEQIAAAKPGMYFLFSARSHSVLARADTRKPAVAETNGYSVFRNLL
jgi:hypothetical protein